MYDSKSDHARKPRRNRALSAYHVRLDQERDHIPTPALTDDEVIAESLVGITVDERASTRTFTQWDLNRLHVEALAEGEERDETEADLAFQLYGGHEPVALWEWQLLTESDNLKAYDAYLDEHTQMHQDDWFEVDPFDAADYQPGDWRYQDHEVEPVNAYSHDDFWLPIATIEECREHMGADGFSIIHANVARRW